MENGGAKEMINWRFKAKEENKSNGHNITSPKKGVTVREARTLIMKNINPHDKRPMLALAHGDPSIFPCFRTYIEAENAVVEALRSGQYNCYATSIGLPVAREAVAEHLSRDLPYKLSSDDVFLTVGCTQAIDIVLSALVRRQPEANILIPRPGYPHYEIRSADIGLEARYYDLVQEKGWEIDIDALQSVADCNTVAIVITNPGNPCGNVFTHKHLHKVAEAARKLGILVISDEVYGHLTFGSNPFVPMGVFAEIVPVITVGSLSKRWIVPGWRLGWLALNDTQGLLQKHKVVENIERTMNLFPDPVSFIQAAVPQILKQTSEKFFSKVIDILRHDADICYEKLKEIPCMTCPYKPQGCMFVMVKLEMSLLQDIQDDVDFCVKLAKEEKVIVLPGTTVGLGNWLRITFALEPSFLEEGLERMKAFCRRHASGP